MNMDTGDKICNSEIYSKGLHTGMMMVRRELGSYVQGILMKLYELSARQTDGKDNNEAIFIASSIYSYIYRTDRLFQDMYRQGVLLTEPEMMFGRVANDEESRLPLDELHLRWLEERKKERKDRNDQ